MRQLQVRDVMTPRVVTAAPDTPLAQVAGVLTGHRISTVPILGDHGRLLGVVSEADLLPHVLRRLTRSDVAIRYSFDDDALARSRAGRIHPFSAEPFGP